MPLLQSILNQLPSDDTLCNTQKEYVPGNTIFFI